MEHQDAAIIIRKMADSLRSNPEQFHFNVDVSQVGQHINMSGGGTGLSISVTGGGPRSSTIGQTINIGPMDIKIRADAAKTALSQQMLELIESLYEVADQLDTKKPDESVIAQIVTSLKQSWVPPLITAVVTAATGIFGG